jgi:hypothetical protein
MMDDLRRQNGATGMAFRHLFGAMQLEKSLRARTY